MQAKRTTCCFLFEQQNKGNTGMKALLGVHPEAQKGQRCG